MQPVVYNLKHNYGYLSYIYIRYILNFLYLFVYIMNIREMSFVETFSYGIGIGLLLLIGIIYHILVINNKSKSWLHFAIFIFDICLIFIIYNLIVLNSVINAGILWKSIILFLIPVFTLIGMSFYEFTRKFILFINALTIIGLIILTYNSYRIGLQFSLERKITIQPTGINLLYPYVMGLFYSMICFMVYRIKTIFKNYALELEQKTQETRKHLARMKWLHHDMKKISYDMDQNISLIHNFINNFNKEMQEEVSAIEEVSATMEELTGTANKSNELISKQYQEIQEIQTINQKLITSVQEIQNSLQSLSEEITKTKQEASSTQNAIQTLDDIMEEIQKSFNEVSEITEVMNEIADKTNLLSLNASIEAARAGEHGKGFAVVAQEINRLAESSIENAKHIDNIVKQSGNFIEKGSRSTTFTKNQIQTQYEQIQKVVNFFDVLKEKITEQVDLNHTLLKSLDTIHSLSREIEQIAKEQTQSSDSVNQTMAEMEKGIMALTQKSQELSSNIEQLKELSVQLKTIENSQKDQK